MIFVLILVACTILAWIILGHYVRYASVMIEETIYEPILNNVVVAYNVTTFCAFLSLLFYALWPQW